MARSKLRRVLLTMGSAIAIMLASTFVVMPAYAATYTFPPYNGPTKILRQNTCCDFALYDKTAGNLGVTSSPNVNGGSGTATVYLSSSTTLCYTSSQTVTISGISARVKGFLWASGSGGSAATIQVMAYVGKASVITDAVSGSISTVLVNSTTSGSVNYDTTLTGPNKTVTVPAGSYKVVLYANAQTAGPTSSVSHFSDFDGTGRGITNFRVTLTAPQNQC